MRPCSYGVSTVPDRAFTAEMSCALIEPDAFTSNLKFDAFVVCVERAFTAMMSPAFTARELFTSPAKNPTDTGDGLMAPLTLLSVTVTR